MESHLLLEEYTNLHYLHFIIKEKKDEKICLSYFATIAYEDTNLNILNINLLCMPNGELEKHYGTRVLAAGKNLDKSRFKFTEIPNFELLTETQSRVKVVYFDKNMSDNLKKKLSFYEDLYATN